MNIIFVVVNFFHAVSDIIFQYSFFPEVESRTQGSRPRPRIQKKSEAKAKDSLSEDRHSRGQGQECSRPRTQAQVLSKKKKKVFTKIFQAISTKKCFPKHFSSAPQNFYNLKNSAVFEPRTGQFSRTWGLEAKDLTFEAKAKDFKMCPRGLHLCFFHAVSDIIFNII